MSSASRRARWTVAVLSAVLAGCSQYVPFDSVAHLRGELAARLGATVAQQIEVPFQLSPELEEELSARLPRSSREAQRVEQVLELIFGKLRLSYAVRPTRDAVGTWATQEGNCLSFVNLFVGIARSRGLDPFYVEVVDHQGWRHTGGLVLSQGHIVAGLYLAGELRTYDFLPYRAKSYKQFAPITDLAATAHFYNNLGAEALLDGDAERAEELVDLAVSVAPEFVKALNNLGVVRARRGDFDGALAAYRQGLEHDPENVPLLSNLTRLYQQLGRSDEADATLARIDQEKTTSPFYFVYLGDLELARGDARAGLELMAKAFRLESEIPEVHLGLARAYLALGELGKAQHHVGRALQLDATDPEARRLAIALAAQTVAE